MRRLLLASLAVVAAVALTGCASSESPSPDIPFQETQGAPQASPASCEDDPALTTAVQTVIDARQPHSTIKVYGEAGGRAGRLIDGASSSDFAAEKNPSGQGVIVSLVYPSGPDFARSTATRAGWLVLSGTVYPIGVDGAESYGLLFNGYPSTVKAAAGINPASDDELDAFNIDDFIAYNADTQGEFDAFLSAANALCETPTEFSG